MQPLYQCSDRIEAQLLHDFLDRHLIQSIILGDYLSGAIGELPADIYPTVWLIHDEDRKRGHELLERFFSSRTPDSSATPWVCPSCGESVSADFDLCWNCSRARPEPG